MFFVQLKLRMILTNSALIITVSDKQPEKNRRMYSICETVYPDICPHLFCIQDIQDGL